MLAMGPLSNIMLAMGPLSNIMLAMGPLSNTLLAMTPFPIYASHDPLQYYDSRDPLSSSIVLTMTLKYYVGQAPFPIL